MALLDVTALSKPDRARELALGQVLLYLFKSELTADERAILEGFADEAGERWRVIVAKSPLPDRHQVRIGPALVVYDAGQLKAQRPGALESRAMLDRWLRSIKRALPGKENP